MNKKILISGLSIVTTLILVGGSAFAAFSDTATSQNNTFATGDANLQIAADDNNSPGSYGNFIPAPAVNETGIYPGFTKNYKFWLKNTSTSTINLNLAVDLSDIVTTGNSDIANQFKISFKCGDADATNAYSVNTWDSTSAKSLNMALSPDTQVQCKMTASLENVDNSYQNSSVRFDGLFTGTQGS